jgi:hypothetical protein
MASGRRRTVGALVLVAAVLAVAFFHGGDFVARGGDASVALLDQLDADGGRRVLDFCDSDEELQGAPGTSSFIEIVGDKVREAARRAAASGGNASPADVATLSTFVEGMGHVAQCHWAKYTSLPLPDGVEMRMCTHDPDTDIIVSKRIHDGGVWFGSAVWTGFRSLLVKGSCPRDRPVVLDFGMHSGYVCSPRARRVCMCVFAVQGVCEAVCYCGTRQPACLFLRGVCPAGRGPRCRSSPAATSSPSRR